MAPQEKKELELPGSEDTPLPQFFEPSGKRHYLEPFIVLARRKRFILIFTVAVAVLTVAYTLTMPTYYMAKARMLPPQQGQSFATAMAEQLGGLGPLLGMVGGGNLLKNPGDVYVAMLKSRTVGDNLVDRFSLMSLYKKQLREDARGQLAGLSEIAANKDGTISISVEDRDPKRAAEIANAYVDELEKLTKGLAVTDAAKRRIFFEREAKVANDELASAEQALKQTQESTGIFALDAQSRAMLEAYAELRAQVSAKEVEVRAMEAYATPENPDLVRAKNQLAALRSELAHYEQGAGGRPVEDTGVEKLPSKALLYARKLREVKYRELLLQLLLKQYEAARIDEAKDSALIQVMDPAIPPERKSRPHRGIICISLTMLAFLVACAWSLFREGIERAKEDPQYLARLQLLKFYLSRKRKTEDLSR